VVMENKYFIDILAICIRVCNLINVLQSWISCLKLIPTKYRSWPDFISGNLKKYVLLNLFLNDFIKVY